jgi:hypothetical protein
MQRTGPAYTQHRRRRVARPGVSSSLRNPTQPRGSLAWLDRHSVTLHHDGEWEDTVDCHPVRDDRNRPEETRSNGRSDRITPSAIDFIDRSYGMPCHTRGRRLPLVRIGRSGTFSVSSIIIPQNPRHHDRRCSPGQICWLAILHQLSATRSPATLQPGRSESYGGHPRKPEGRQTGNNPTNVVVIGIDWTCTGRPTDPPPTTSTFASIPASRSTIDTVMDCEAHWPSLRRQESWSSLLGRPWKGRETRGTAWWSGREHVIAMSCAVCHIT